MFLGLIWGFPKIGVPFVGVPLRAFYSIWGIQGVPLFGKCPYRDPSSDLRLCSIIKGSRALCVILGLNSTKTKGTVVAHQP